MPLAAGVAQAQGKCTPPGQSTQYPGNQCRLAVSNANPRPGETISTDGNGYASNSTVDESINSAPRHLVNAHTDANGNFVQSVTIPCDIGPGDHTISAAGV